MFGFAYDKNDDISKVADFVLKEIEKLEDENA